VLKTEIENLSIHSDPCNFRFGRLDILVAEAHAVRVELVEVGLDNLGHDEGGLLDPLPLPCDCYHHVIGSYLSLLDSNSGASIICNSFRHLWYNETRFDLDLSLTGIFFRGFLTLEKFERGFLTLEKFERGFLTLEKVDLEKFDLEKFDLEKFDLEKFELEFFHLGFFELDLGNLNM